MMTYPEVFLCDGERVEHFGVNLFVFEINQVHLLADLLQGRLRAQRCQIGTHVTVRLRSNLLQVDVIRELHVFGVNAQNFETSSRVRDSDVHLSIETSCKYISRS